MSRLRLAILLTAAAATFATLVSLGTWQLHRLAWKEGLIARVEANLEAPPASIEAARRMVREGEDIEFRPVRLSGQFLPGEAHYFATWKSTPGWFVYAPLRLADGTTLMVNRGFVPHALKDPSTRPDHLPEGTVTFDGLLRSAPAQKPNVFVNNNDLGKNVFHWKSLNQMATAAIGDKPGQLERFFVDAGAEAPTGPRGPVGGVTRIAFPNNHLGYAITWYGLAAALLGVLGFSLFSRRARAPS